MEVVAAALGVVDIAARSSSKLWKLCEIWKNAPRDIYELRDEVDRAIGIYKIVEANLRNGEKTEEVSAELLALLQSGVGIVTDLQELIDELLYASGAPEQERDQPTRVTTRDYRPRVEGLMKRRRLLWMTKTQRVKYLRRVLKGNIDQIGLQLILMNLWVSKTRVFDAAAADFCSRIVTTNVPAKIQEQLEGALTTGLRPTVPIKSTERWVREVQIATNEVSPFPKDDTPNCDQGSDEDILYDDRSPTLVDAPIRPFSMEPGYVTENRDGPSSVSPADEPDSENDQLALKQDLLHGFQKLLIGDRDNPKPLMHHPPPKVVDEPQPWSDFIAQTAKKLQLSRTCDEYCRCTCHSVTSYGDWIISTPQRLFGSVSVNFTGVSMFGTKHSDPSCLNRNRPRRVKISYRLPEWLAAATFSVLYSDFSGRGPEMLLRVRRRVKEITTNPAIHDAPADTTNCNIFWLSYKGDIEAIKYLILSGQASIFDEYEKGGKSPLDIAILTRQVGVVRFLLQAGADVYQEDEFGVQPIATAFHLFLSGDQKAKAYAELLPFDQHLEDEDYSDLHKVIVGVIPLSLEEALRIPRFRSQINSRTRSGFTAMHLARSPDMIHLLAAAGADPNMKARGGVTAMRQAYRRGDPAAIEALIECGADLNDYDAHGMRHLRGLAQFISPKIAGGTRLLDMMVRGGADIHAVCGKNMSVLAAASAAGHWEYVEYLVAAGAQVNIRDWVGDTPLFEAVHAKCKRSVRTLLDNGADYTNVRTSGETILHMLAMYAGVEMMKMFEVLRMRGVDSNMSTREGKTPRDFLDRRKDVTPEISEAFERIIESVDADLTSSEAEEDESESSVCDQEDGDEFFDAAESNE